MKIKKYPQSHLVITNDAGDKLVIDPGSLTFDQGFKTEEFQGADAYLITHQHEDHLGSKTISQVASGKPIHGNADVVGKLKSLGIEAIEAKDRQTFPVGGFEITPIDLPHCKMRDGSGGPPNTGFLINGILFHPGDGDKAPGSLTSQNLALPIAGPTITFHGALEFARQVQAKVVIPIHYDFFKADPEEFAKVAAPIEVRPLAPGEETTI